LPNRHFHLSTFKYPDDPVDPVIRVLFSFHDLFIAPIYYRGMGLICITLSSLGLPRVNLNLVRDDLRMMAPKPVAAKAGAMKDIEDLSP
jgi:hypothetical protein